MIWFVYGTSISDGLTKDLQTSRFLDAHFGGTILFAKIVFSGLCCPASKEYGILGKTNNVGEDKFAIKMT